MTKDELVTLLKSDVAEFNKYREKNPNQEHWDWRGVDLDHAGLKGADLRRIDLTGASFRETDLREAQFGGSILRGATFKGADLTDANFHHAQMQGADLRGTNFGPRTRMGRLCVNLASFDEVRWDKAFLEEVLALLNRNRDWQIRYELVAKGEASSEVRTRRV